MSRMSSESLQGKKGSPRDKKSDYVWQGFVDIPLSEAQKADFKSWNVEADDILAAVASVVTDGYKVTLSHDEKHGTYQASLTCLADGDPNRGFTMSGRAGDPLKALAVALYKHLEIAQGGVWANVASTTPRDDIS